jgi:hypothetical protein
MSKFSRLFKKSTSALRPLPDFVIIGAQKAGTTFLYEVLCQHPRVLEADKKEIHYFDSPRFQKGELWYRAHFPFPPGSKDKYQTGEASAYYILHPHTPRRMAELIPQTKIIALLRNPVERAYSNYHQQSRKEWESLSFEEAIEAEPQRLAGEVERMLADESYDSFNHRHYSYLARGVYVDQLKAFEKYFPREQMLVIKSEGMFEKTPEIFARTLDFLGLPSWQPEKFAPSNVGKYSNMNPQTRKWLEEYFAPHNQRLYEYLGEDFGW